MQAIRGRLQALLIIELDGPEAEVDVLINRVSEIVKASGATLSVSASLKRNGTSSGQVENLHFRL